MDCAQCHEIIDDDSHFCDQCGTEVRTCVSCGKPGKGKRCTGCGDHVSSVRDRATGGSSASTASGSPPPATTAPVPAPTQAPPTASDALRATSSPVSLSPVSSSPASPSPASPPPLPPSHTHNTPPTSGISSGARACSTALPPDDLGAGATRRLSDSEGIAAAIPELRLLNKNIQVDIRIDPDTLIGRAAGPHVALFSRFDQVSSRHCRFSFEPGQGWSVTDLGSTNKTHYNNRPLTPQTPQVLSDQSHLKIANIEFFVRLTPSSGT